MGSQAEGQKACQSGGRCKGRASGVRGWGWMARGWSSPDFKSRMFAWGLSALK